MKRLNLNMNNLNLTLTVVNNTLCINRTGLGYAYLENVS